MVFIFWGRISIKEGDCPMRQLAAIEVLALTKSLEGEMHALSMAKTSLINMKDEDLKSVTQVGIKATEIRIARLQEFIAENNMVPNIQQNTVQ